MSAQQTEVSAEDMALLRSLSGGERLLTPHGKRRMQTVIERGFVDLVPARCGPLGIRTGEFFARLTAEGNEMLRRRKEVAQ
jgi:hypothetical protein